MKKSLNYIPSFTTALLLWFAFAAVAQPRESKVHNEDASVHAFKLIEQMFESCSNVQSMACEVQKKERFNGAYVEARSRIKMTTQPYSVYLKQIDDADGIELLYREEANSGKVLVNPNGFPWINISLDPYGSLIRNNQHHLISDIGFSKFNRILSHLLKKYEDVGAELTRYEGTATINNRECHVVEIQNKQFDLVPYTTGPNETTMSVAEKFKISEYRIVELNEEVSGFGDLKAGLVLTIPNDYAPRIRLFIDQQRHIPMRFEVYDNEGALFESYEYDHVEINAAFAENELSEEFPGYGF